MGSVKRDEGKYTEQMYMHISKCFLEKFKGEPTQTTQTAMRDIQTTLNQLAKDLRNDEKDNPTPWQKQAGLPVFDLPIWKLPCT